MMQMILRVLLSAAAVVALSYMLPGVMVNSFTTAILVAIVLGLLNFLVRPILVILTLPITVVTLGLFLLVLNALVVLMADYLIDGFSVASFWWALGFSLALSLLQSVLYSLLKKDKKSKG